MDRDLEDPVDDFFATPAPRPEPADDDESAEQAIDEQWLAEQRQVPPTRRVAVVLAVLLPFLVSVLAVVWALVRASSQPPLAEATVPGMSTIERLEDGAYSLWARNADGLAVRWNACEPIRWVFNPNGAPLGAVDVLKQAMDMVEEQTGLTFEYLGETPEVPQRNRPPWQPDLYDRDQWAPVLIAWRTPLNTDAPLSNEDRAVAIPVAVGDSQFRVFVTAQVIFNADHDAVPGFRDRRRSIGITMLHELLHVIGLQHVDEPEEIMFPFPVVGSATFGPGDLAGMQEVGADHPCLPTPEPRELTVEYSG